MRRRAGAAAGIIVACLAGIAAPSAAAETYCAGPDEGGPAQLPCPGFPLPLRNALELASVHPGADTVGLNPGNYRLASNLVYDDRGQPDNAVTIEGMYSCGRYGCGVVQLRGESASGSLLSFGGGGGAAVTVRSVNISSEGGATALTLPPGGLATSVSAFVVAGGVAVRLEGTAARPAVMRGGGVFAPRGGGSRGVAVDVSGRGVLEQVGVSGDIGARVGPGGSLDVLDGNFDTTVGVTGSHARVAGTTVNMTNPGDRSGGAVAFEAVCPDATSPDADVSVTNATVIGGARTDTTGVRAAGRGGDGTSCDAVARVSSTILSRVAVPIHADGEAGSGAAPQEGHARVEASYSNFDAEAISVEGPAEVETAVPGGNVDVSSGFYYPQTEGSTGPEALLPDIQLRWDSPMIDRGDPAAPEAWQAPWIPVIHGRRDIGAFEYGFSRPTAGVTIPFSYPIPPGRTVRFQAVPYDDDGDQPLALRWELSDGSTSTSAVVDRTYRRPGLYTERAIVTDPTGLTGEESVKIRVVRQRIFSLYLTNDRFRPTRRLGRPGKRGGSIVNVNLAGQDLVTFRVERRLRGRRSGRARWVRLPGFFEAQVEPKSPDMPFFSGWLAAERLRPGKYRLVARARAAPRRPARTRFTIVR